MQLKYIRSAIIIVFCLVILAISEFLIQSTMKKVNTGTIGKINAVMSHELDAEITIWGASTAYVNINPKIMIDSLNVSTINMGIDGTNIDQYSGLLEEYLSYSKKSKKIIIALDIHGGITDRNKLYDLHNWTHHLSNENISNTMMSIDSSLIWKSKHVPFYKLTLYNKHDFPFFRKALFKRKEEVKLPSFGYKENGLKTIRLSDQSKLNTRVIKIGSRCIEKIQTICQIALKQNIEPIIVITPTYISGQLEISNLNELEEVILSIESDDVKVLNYLNSSISNNPKYFVDNTHLNKLGANNFTSILLKDLKGQ